MARNGGVVAIVIDNLTKELFPPLVTERYSVLARIGSDLGGWRGDGAIIKLLLMFRA